ncbi:hypothetical protein M0R04_11450 [Candidatus Dojkabacteria bacterium]|jgi:hypothetical protein|nr:hypothetical protein [Candidatus Dojkabacteria bacterium]
MTTKTPVNQTILNECKKQFMEYVPIKTIAAQTGLNRTTIQYHANNYWNTEREMLKSELFRNFAEQKKVIMTDMSSAALKILTRALEATAKGDEPPSLRDATQAAAILESIDKILRLDDGAPTEITEVKATTTVELKKRLLADPFADVKWVDQVKGVINVETLEPE